MNNLIQQYKNVENNWKKSKINMLVAETQEEKQAHKEMVNQYYAEICKLQLLLIQNNLFHLV